MCRAKLLRYFLQNPADQTAATGQRLRRHCHVAIGELSYEASVTSDGFAWSSLRRSLIARRASSIASRSAASQPRRNYYHARSASPLLIDLRFAPPIRQGGTVPALYARPVSPRSTDRQAQCSFPRPRPGQPKHGRDDGTQTAKGHGADVKPVAILIHKALFVVFVIG